MACGNVFLNKYFYLYGKGISNLAVANYFNENKISYNFVNEDNIKLISNDNIVIKSPGIPRSDTKLNHLIEQNIPIISDIELFYCLKPNIKYIGITGTSGKTTTCTILYEILQQKYKVKVCGNIGIPIFNYIEEEVDYLIVELSSYQLEYIKTFKPTYFIVLNVFPHHLNNHLTFERYLMAKLNPISNLDNNSTLIINNSLISHLNSNVNNYSLVTFSENLINGDVYCINNIVSYIGNCYKITDNNYFKLDFNITNFLSIYPIIVSLNIENTIINNVLNKFNQLEHRMEKIISTDNLVIINDSKSTCIMSLYKAFENCKRMYNDFNIVIICGGKLDIDEIQQNSSLLNNIKTNILYLYGENANYLSKLLSGNIIIFNTLEEVIGDLLLSNKMLILFSPGAQSFDQYQSYIERGNSFKNLINNKLKK